MSANQESASTTPGPGQGRTSAGCLPVGEGCGTPNGAAACRVVYFSSVSQNTKRFVDSLGFDAVRLPLYERREPMPVMDGPYVLIVPTYGGGSPKGAVPKQVIHFLNIPVNRSWIRGVISSGNRNFGQAFCKAGPIIAEKCGVPELYRFELLGTREDRAAVRAILTREGCRSGYQGDAAGAGGFTQAPEQGD